MSDIAIRLAQATDIDHLAAIERAAGQIFPPGLLPDPEHTHPPHELAQALTDGLLFVAANVSCPVGFLVSRIQNNQLHLDELSVHPNFGRQGIGRRLVNTTFELARQRSLSGVTLTTFSHIPWNRPFYESCGFYTLTAAQLSPVLAEILAQEAADGLTHRIAMQADLTDEKSI